MSRDEKDAMIDALISEMKRDDEKDSVHSFIVCDELRLRAVLADCLVRVSPVVTSEGARAEGSDVVEKIRLNLDTECAYEHAYASGSGPLHLMHADGTESFICSVDDLRHLLALARVSSQTGTPRNEVCTHGRENMLECRVCVPSTERERELLTALDFAQTTGDKILLLRAFAAPTPSREATEPEVVERIASRIYEVKKQPGIPWEWLSEPRRQFLREFVIAGIRHSPPSAPREPSAAMVEAWVLDQIAKLGPQPDLSKSDRERYAWAGKATAYDAMLAHVTGADVDPLDAARQRTP